MQCDFCGLEPAEPETLRPVREVVTVTERGPNACDREVLGDESVACEECYPEAFDPERIWRLEHECPRCWSFPCDCSKETLRGMMDEFTLRMLGDNVTLMRCAWLELLDELRPESETAKRIRTMLEPE